MISCFFFNCPFEIEVSSCVIFLVCFSFFFFQFCLLIINNNSLAAMLRPSRASEHRAKKKKKKKNRTFAKGEPAAASSPYPQFILRCETIRTERLIKARSRGGLNRGSTERLSTIFISPNVVPLRPSLPVKVRRLFPSR